VTVQTSQGRRTSQVRIRQNRELADTSGLEYQDGNCSVQEFGFGSVEKEPKFAVQNLAANPTWYFKSGVRVGIDLEKSARVLALL
jgi:hypothetical protein